MRQSHPGPDGVPRLRPRQKREPRFADEARFIKAWLDNPKTTGSVYPSGKVLSRAMAQAVDVTIPGPIVELGPGTGPVTEALIRRGIPQDRLILVEFDPDFCKLLARRYPGATVVEGDAYSLDRSLAAVLTEKAAAVVSSLPLLTKPEIQRIALLADAFDLMAPDGVFVQFTYGLVSPVPRVDDTFAPTHFSAHGSAPVWLNLPPARVWTYRAALSADPTRKVFGPEFRRKLKESRDKISDKIGDEIRETRERLRREFLIRSEKAKAQIRARADKKAALEHAHAMRLEDAFKPIKASGKSRSSKTTLPW